MPISRYEIRNEYSLADPELYRAADKDDPEALLEGVAMAGLVGVLRQLGDLAEFAADIFHNLHEDVMATAARGHVLAVRVQQLENEIPSLERAFLSQTDHSSLFYHPGLDWHHNLRLNKNLVTQGDMPRFIMDSYEECRAPPRLFLLDKFDVAGAGACLKRYTDPSFYKIESSEMTNADIQREKKIRKTKKKGPRWKNREIPEVLPTTHTKLHQLFLEERVENGFNTPSRHAKLKRRLNGFPFNSKTGKSCMEEILRSPSPDHEVLHDMYGDSPQLKFTTNGHKEFGSEISEFRPVNPDRESGGRKSTRLSPDIEGVALRPRMSDPDEYPIDDNIFEESNSHPSIATDDISSALDKVTGEKVVVVGAESNREGSLTGYGSDDMASEIDNYVDAPSTMELELDRDFDLRIKNENASDIKMESLIIDAYEEPLHPRSSDSLSTGDSTTSDVENNASTKEISSFISDSPDISVEKSQSEISSSKGFQCTDILVVNMIVGASSYQETADEESPVDHHSTPVVSDDPGTETDEIVRNCLPNPPESDVKVSTFDDEEENSYQTVGPSPVVSDGTCTETNAITNRGSEFEQVTSTMCIDGSMPTLELSDTEEASEKFELEGKIEKINLVVDPPCSLSAALGSQTESDDLSRSSDQEKSVEERNGEIEPCFSAKHDDYNHTTDSSVETSSKFLHEDESDVEDQELADDAASTLNVHNVLSKNGTLGTMSSGNVIPDEFENEFPTVPEKSLSDYPDAAINGDHFEPKGDDLVGEWDDKDPDVSTHSPNHFSSTMEASSGKGIEETSLVSACELYVEVNHSESSLDNQIGLENRNLLHVANSPDRPLDDCDVHEGDVIPEDDTAVNETLPPEIPERCEVVGLEGTGISNYLSPIDSEALERLHCTSEDLEVPAGTSDAVGKDGISPYSVFNAQEVIEFTSPADMRPKNEIYVSLNKSGSEADRSKFIDITSPVPAVSDDAIKLVEEHSDCFEDSGMHELENDNKVGATEAFASGFGTIGCNPVDNGHTKSELSASAPNSHFDSELDNSSEFVHASKIQSALEQCGLNREEELFKSSLENHVPDAPTLPVDNDIKESEHLDQNIQHPIEISPELSSLSPINYLQILDGDGGKAEGNSISAFSLTNGSSPPSISEVSKYPKDPLGSVSPTSNPFLETNQINLADLPPLPPLPPVQWRMGKLQHALPKADEEMVRNEESFSPLISLTAPLTVDVGSTLSARPTQDGGPPPTTSTDDIISLREESKDSPAELAAETTSKEENPDNSCTSSDAKTSHETTNHLPNVENKPQLLATPVSESVSTSSAAETTPKEENPDNSCSSSDAKTSHETANHLPKVENKPQLLATPVSERVSTSSAAETTSKEENLDNSCSSSDAKTSHETTNHLPKLENKPQLLATPVSESVSTSSVADDGAENGNQKVKLPRPRNPLVDDVSFLDKSKLRKVTERVRPEIPKVDKRDSLLEQIRAKSFNLRPAMASRPSIRTRGPNTNLRVVAILDKANAIRQALAGSDEEDDDSWSE